MESISRRHIRGDCSWSSSFKAKESAGKEDESAGRVKEWQARCGAGSRLYKVELVILLVNRKY